MKKARKEYGKNHTEEILNKKRYLDHVTEASIIEGPIEKVNPKEMATEIKPIKPRKQLDSLK